MTTRLFINDIFELNDRTLRFVHVNSQKKLAYVIAIDGSKDPIEWKLDALKAMRSDRKGGLVVVAEEPAQRPSPSAKDVAVRDTRWSRIESLVNHPDIWNKELRPGLIREQAAKFKVSTKALRAYLRTFWAGGQNPDALLGNYHRSGRIEESTEGSLSITENSASGPQTIVFAPAKQHARGRWPTDKDHRPFPIPAALREMILKDAKKQYEDDARISVNGVTTAILNRYFALRDHNGDLLLDDDGAAVLKPVGQRPSFRQIQYMLCKALVISAAFKRRHSAAEFDNNHAPSTGSVLDDTLGPGDVFEIDATVLDFWVVAKVSRKHVIGKPALFLVIDRASRLIVGFYLTLENPSWAEATQAILSISGDWRELCERLGVPYKESDWPAAGVMPNRFFGDRADMLTYESNALCDGVAVQVTNAPALMSADKPIAESGFRSLQTPLRQHAPGYEPPENVTQRRKKKYHKDACLDLDETAAVLLRLVIAHNRKAKEGYQASPEEILGGLSTAPIHIWQRAVEERMGAMSRMPIDLLRRKLMPRGTAKVHVDGIHFQGCVYEGKELGEWLARASIRGVFDVQVSYTTNLVDVIVVHDKFVPGKQHEATLTSKSRAFKGYTFAEVKYVADAAKSNKRRAKRKNEGHDVAALEDMNAVSQPALQQTRALTSGVGPGARLTDGDKLRALEAGERRRELLGVESSGVQYGTIAQAVPVAVEVFEDVPDFDNDVQEQQSYEPDPDTVGSTPDSIQYEPEPPDATSVLRSMLGI